MIGQGQFAIIAAAGLEESLEKRCIETLPAGQSLVPSAEKFKTKGRPAFRFG